MWRNTDPSNPAENTIWGSSGQWPGHAPRPRAILLEDMDEDFYDDEDDLDEDYDDLDDEDDLDDDGLDEDLDDEDEDDLYIDDDEDL